MFCSTDTAARVERAETDLILGTARAAGERTGPSVWVHELAGGVAALGPAHSPLNKVAGLGFEGLPSEAELAEVEAAFDARQVPVQVELSNLADPALAKFLSARGYALIGFEDVLGRSLRELEREEPPAGIEVEASGREQFDLWLDLVVEGFAHPDAQGAAVHEEFPRDVLADVIRDMVRSGNFLRTLARRAGEPAGGASLRMTDGVAQLCGAATLPAHRRRGVQTALLLDRLARARDAGCDLAVVTTAPGSKSQENVCRRGFAKLYTRALLVRE